jgi:hypothetical protein
MPLFGLADLYHPGLTVAVQILQRFVVQHTHRRVAKGKRLFAQCCFRVTRKTHYFQLTFDQSRLQAKCAYAVTTMKNPGRIR